jgi:putative ABC transport system substrate-binding protein
MARYAGHLSRRLFLRGTLAQASLGLLAACGLLPSRASPAKRPRVGLLMIDNLGQFPGAFQLGLGELGYAPGAVNIDFRWTESADRLSELAAELVALNVDVIIVPNSQAALAAKQATDAVPIVFAGAGDPVGTGLVTSLAHPGGTITGLTRLSSQLSTKRLELLKEVVPEASRVAVLLNPFQPRLRPRPQRDGACSADAGYSDPVARGQESE